MCVCVVVWTGTGAACACTWPAALLKLGRELVEKKEKFEEHNGNGEERDSLSGAPSGDRGRDGSWCWEPRGGEIKRSDV